MKILYLGTVCDLSEYEIILQKCKTKPTVATVVFESAMLKGLKANDADLTVYSFPMIPYYPNSKLLFWGNRKQQLDCRYSCTWLKTINIPVIKQISRRIDGRRLIKKWLKENKKEQCAILSYSMPPFLVKDIIKYSKKFGVPCYAIVADLPRDMYMNQKHNSLEKWLKEKYLKQTVDLQGQFDGYIYFTKYMKDVINPDKPYIVVEGISEAKVTAKLNDKTEKDVFSVMYAGGLYEKYGIINLIDAFERLDKSDAELWIFGDGTASEIIIDRAENNPKIKFFGRKTREEVLIYEKKASLLVNPRSPSEEYTKYSFPSKTIEYMLSGTPLLTTKLPGIPDEYLEHIYTAANNDIDTLVKVLEEIMSFSDESRAEKGKQAQRFIVENKNPTVQAKKIVGFICEN